MAPSITITPQGDAALVIGARVLYIFGDDLGIAVDTTGGPTDATITIPPREGNL